MVNIQFIRRILGIGGIAPNESAYVKQVNRIFELALLLIAIWLPIQWYSERHHLFVSHLYIYTNWVIWFAFVAETVVMTYLTKHKGFYLLTNWLNLAIIILLFPLFWMHYYVTTAIRIIRFCLMFRFLLPWFEFSTSFLARNHLGTTLLVAVLLTTSSGILLASFDPAIPTAGAGIWWAWQTITTVGYGDVVPHSFLGRILSVFIMIFGIGLLAVLTANFSAFFLEKHQRLFLKEHKNKTDHLDFVAVMETLKRLENKLASIEKSLSEKDHPHRQKES